MNVAHARVTLCLYLPLSSSCCLTSPHASSYPPLLPLALFAAACWRTRRFLALFAALPLHLSSFCTFAALFCALRDDDDEPTILKFCARPTIDRRPVVQAGRRRRRRQATRTRWSMDTFPDCCLLLFGQATWHEQLPACEWLGGQAASDSLSPTPTMHLPHCCYHLPCYVCCLPQHALSSFHLPACPLHTYPVLHPIAFFPTTFPNLCMPVHIIISYHKKARKRQEQKGQEQVEEDGQEQWAGRQALNR